MSDLTTIDLFAEDHAHQAFLRALIERIALEERRQVRISDRAALGGHGRVYEELRVYQQTRALFRSQPPDLLVVAIDANCQGYAQVRDRVLGEVGDQLRERVVAACPDPHIERWFLADLPSFHTVVGVTPAVQQGKCERDYYKQTLAQAVVRAGHPPMLGGLEFASEIVTAMDLYRAGRTDASLRHFVKDLVGLLRRA